MVSRRARCRTLPAIVLAAALTLIAIGLPTGAADAADRSPWDAIAQCESGGDWSIDTGNGYYGGLQFSSATWAAHGGRGSAATASRIEQIRVGRRVVASQGWEAWSGCSARLGLHGRQPEHRRTAHRTVRQARDDLMAGITGEQRAAQPGSGAAEVRIRPCTAKTLRVRYADDGSVAGVRYVDLELVNTGAHRCRLAGASRMTHPTGDQDDERIVATAAALALARHVEVATKQPYLVLSARSGHARSRVAVEAAAGRGERCRPATITLRRGGLDTGDPALDGLRLQTCADTRYEVLSLGHPRAGRSATRS